MTLSFLRRAWPLLVVAAMGAAQAQSPSENPDWAETAAPPPPVFDASRLIPIDMPRYLSLRYGIDPKTITIGKDSIVRYVLVTVSPTGTVNAIYEGLRCDNGTAKTYARNAGSGWNPIASPDWRTMLDGSAINMGTVAVARQGGCDGHAPPRTVEDMVRRLRSPYPAPASPS